MSRKGAGTARGARGADPPPPPETSAEGGQRRLRWILLGVVVTVSSVLVTGAFVPAPHTGGDNATYLSLAYSLAAEGSYTELFDPARLPHTKYPPVFPGLLAALMLLGARTWSAFKAVAVASTVGAAALTFLWAERRLGAVWGAGVALLFAASSAVVYYSHWILSDASFLAFTLLALWALDRADDEGSGNGWLALGVASAALAYFTRSAGLPLVVSLGGWLALRRRWRALGATAVALGVPMALWMLRARGAGEGEYVAEFWLVNPYQPELGRVGVGGLVARFLENLAAYVTAHIPGGVVGSGGGAVAALGVVLVAAAAVGWAVELRKRPGPAELLLPLYVGLILLWPAVWSGDRFALPLYPLLFLYAARALRGGAGRLGRTAVSAAGAAAFLVVLVPALGAWTGAVREASACGALVRRGGPFACYGPGVAAFVEAAGWAGANLPEGSAVLTRKPSFFFVLSGVPSRTFPFSADPAAHLRLANRLGVRYELLDEWDALAGRYVAGAVSASPGSFCSVRGFGGEGRTHLLGVLPAESRGPAAASADRGVRIVGCPAGYLVGDGSASSSLSSRIPLLDTMDP